MRCSIRGAALAAVTCLATAVVPAVATAKPKPTSGGGTSSKAFVVCKHGCRYTTIQTRGQCVR